jgi:prevent-host-death family protein
MIKSRKLRAGRTGRRVTVPVPAAEFKARCLELVNSVREARTEYVITNHGRPVARLVPIDDAPVQVFGRLAGTVTHEGDIVSPIAVSWEALE